MESRENANIRDLPDLSVCMNDIQKHNDLVTPQKVEGALG